MHRIDGPGATAESTFTEGDPASATPATTVTDAWLNDIQENLCKVIEGVGAPLVKGDFQQLKAAISSMISSAISGIGGLPSGYFSGFGMANNASAPSTTVDISPGVARSSTDVVDVKLASTLRGVLQSSGSWSAGDNQNKLDTGVRANNAKYHVFAIRKTSDGGGDILFSLSATAPTMPNGYAGFRRLGTIFTDASGVIRGFLNTGNLFVFKTPVVDINTASGPTDGTYTMTLPSTVNVRARIAATCYNTGDAAVAVNSPSAAKISATSTPASYVGGAYFSTPSTDNGAWEFVAMAENAQLVFSSAGYLRVTTLGYEELRG